MITITDPRTSDDVRWWSKKDPQERGRAAWTAAMRVDSVTTERQLQQLQAYALYGDRDSWHGLTRAIPTTRRISHNVLANACDTAVAEVMQVEPRPMAQTIGGGYDAQVQAKKLQYHWDWLFEEARQLEIAPNVIRDGYISGLGVERPYIDWQAQTVRFERVFPGHVLVNDRGLIDCEPPEIYIIRAVPKDVLMHRYNFDDDSPHERQRKHEAIRNAEAPSSFFAYLAEDFDSTGMAGVVEAWHLGDSPSCSISVSGYELDGGDYPYDDFPLAFFRPLPPLGGFWGESLVLRAAPTQLELNKLLRRIQDAQHSHARPIIFVPAGASHIATQILNDVATLVHLPRGTTPPTPVTYPSMSGDVYSWVESLVGKVYEEFGISQLTANAMKPAGLDSGKAIRTYRELTSRKFVTAERAVGRLYCDMARLSVRCYRELSEVEPDVEVLYERYGRPERIAWDELDLEDDQLRIQVMPANALSKTVSERQEQLSEWLEAGIIDNEQWLELSEFPDLEGARRRIIAPRKLLEQTFERMLEEGEPSMPLPEQPLELGIDLAKTYIQIGLMDGAPEERIQLVRDWLNEAAVRLDLAAKQAAPPPPPPGMPPPDGMMPPMPPEGAMPPPPPPGGAPPVPMGPPPGPPPPVPMN